jgi:hypothetical protein
VETAKAANSPRGAEAGHSGGHSGCGGGGVENFGGSLGRQGGRRATINGVGGRPAPGSDGPRAPGEERI